MSRWRRIIPEAGGVEGVAGGGGDAWLLLGEPGIELLHQEFTPVFTEHGGEGDGEAMLVCLHSKTDTDVGADGILAAIGFFVDDADAMLGKPLLHGIDIALSATEAVDRDVGGIIRRQRL